MYKIQRNNQFYNEQSCAGKNETNQVHIVSVRCESYLETGYLKILIKRIVQIMIKRITEEV